MPTACSPTTTAFLLARVFLPFACGYYLSYLYRTVNAVIATDLMVSLRLTPADLGLLTSAYFLTFALFQLPLGILLDRFGPRRVETGLLLVAAAGSLLFAMSDGLGGLLVGRALVGLGVSACLMASFKAFVVWFPSHRLPAVNGWVMAAGGLGALTATAPVEALLNLTDWRGIFVILAIMTCAVATLIFLTIPERVTDQPRASWTAQWRAVGQVLSNRYFWGIAPLPTLSQATFMAIQGLWAGPWLRDVAGLDRSAVANHLLLCAAGMVGGSLTVGTLAAALDRLGIPPVRVAGVGMSLFMLAQAAVALGWTGATQALWLVFGFTGTAGSLCYAILSQAFPAELAGRVNTSLNLLVFVTAFIAQWGIGAIINLWPGVGQGYAPQSYQAAFGLLLALQVLAFAWFVLGAEKSR